MREQDFDAFCELVDGAYEMHGKTVTPKAKALFFAAMGRYSLEVVRQALSSHMVDKVSGKFPPVPAHLVAQIEGRADGDGRPGVEEAWALSLPAIDEAETVVWTEEMRDAFMLCRPVLDRGDEVGARMAFKEAYLRMVVEAGRSNRPVKWEATLGHDPQRRVQAIERAAAVGRLPAPQVSLLLPVPVKGEEIDRTGLERVKEACRQLVPASEKAAKRRQAELNAERDREAQRKREIATQVVERGVPVESIENARRLSAGPVSPGHRTGPYEAEQKISSHDKNTPQPGRQA